MSALQTERPRFQAPKLLLAAIFFVVTIFFALVLFPGLLSMAPSSAVTAPEIIVDVTTIAPGELRSIDNNLSVPLAVYRRTAAQIFSNGQTNAKRYPLALVDYPLPATVDATTRSAIPEYFVFYAVDTKYGCKLNYFSLGEKAGRPGWEGGFLDSCHFDYAYDFAGWSLARENGGLPGDHWLPSRNLFVPRHEFRNGKLHVFPHQNDLRKIGGLD